MGARDDFDLSLPLGFSEESAFMASSPLWRWGGHETFEQGWEKSHCVYLKSFEQVKRLVDSLAEVRNGWILRKLRCSIYSDTNESISL